MNLRKEEDLNNFINFGSCSLKINYSAFKHRDDAIKSMIDEIQKSLHLLCGLTISYLLIVQRNKTNI